MRAAALALAMVGGCASASDLDQAVDARLDAGIDTIDGRLPDAESSAGLGDGASCSPVRDQCADGLTCRPYTAVTGFCRQLGAGLPGSSCTLADQCGAGMTCMATGATPRCAIVCDGRSAKARCAFGQVCDLLWGTLGVCRL